MQSNGTRSKVFVKCFLKINKDDMQLEVTLMITYKRGMEDNQGKSSVTTSCRVLIVNTFLYTPPRAISRRNH